ncbi:DUF2171 domain-containing protein [Acetobacteraceae bacterium KSS8]|uniref:DUF2171 domain-containing protein n=1 Tax=Endosaccharibacter trunci TaxID=2812733 RepID=A0ABT1W7K4_9PROT|nr:DUF2171 domain-containing protein [Acetobacteraceae bacterium KSS8]
MADLSSIKPGSRVVASNGAILGVVDAVEGGERLRLRADENKQASGPDYIPSSWVSGIETDLVRLNRDETQARDTMNEDIPAGEETS